MEKKWKILAKNKDVDIVKTLLKNRHLEKAGEIEEFLNPPNPYLLSPQKAEINLKEIKKVVQKIKKAIKEKRKIIIYGDYDADGICATALLWETLYRLKAEAMPFIPHREEHGYGLNKKGIDFLLKNYQNAKSALIITVDNGIIAKEGVAYAQKNGFEVIVTDHHQLGKEKPPVLIVHTDKLSGAGVAWFLAKEIYSEFYQNLKAFKASNALELACIGTITDMMPMKGVNRSLVKFGLKEIQKSKRLGIKALCKQACIKQEEIDVYHLAFLIGPRLNAMGRLEEGLDSLRLLCTKNQERAEKLAWQLGLTNRQRQQLTEITFNDARQKAEKQTKKGKLIFICHSSYNVGVIGLVAGKLVEEFYRPVVIISKNKNYSKGSARSINGFNIIKFLRKLEYLFTDLGGHPMAAGFTIQTKKIKQFSLKIKKLIKKEIKDDQLLPILKVDLEVEFNKLNWQLLNQIKHFSPFGLENNEPLFCSRKVKVVSFNAVGKEQKHLKLKLENSGVTFAAIAFNFAYLIKKIKKGDYFDICYCLNEDKRDGKKGLYLKIKDIKI